MPDVLILIFCVALLPLALGLPLLLKPDSLVPDIITFGFLAVVVPAFVWTLRAYWIIVPIVALVAFVAWLERPGRDWPATFATEDGNRRRDAVGGGAAGTSGPTRFALSAIRKVCPLSTHSGPSA